MKMLSATFRALRGSVLLAGTIFLGCLPTASAQTNTSQSKNDSGVSAALEHDFFAAIREGDAKKFLTYIPQQGVNLGAQAQHSTRDDIEGQFLTHRGLYCKLFDSSCINAPINLDNSARPCSYRELLTHSEKVSTTASEMTRGGVRQAVLVARIKNEQCSNPKLIDFIFNLEAGGWKLFSIP
ncbi:MAG: hypothetical protein WA655_08110 [Candidatus Korobacteraceae bacterium]